METQWINVADTAVKIGLGSLITGFFTFIGLRYTHKSQQSKYLFEHKIKLLEQISTDMDEYFNSVEKLLNRIQGIAKRRNLDGKEEEPLLIAQWESIHEIDQLLVASWPKMRSVIAKLRLINANNVVSKFGICTRIEREVREKIMFKKEMYTYQEIMDIGDKNKFAISEVHQSLAKIYNSLSK